MVDNQDGRNPSPSLEGAWQHEGSTRGVLQIQDAVVTIKTGRVEQPITDAF